MKKTYIIDKQNILYFMIPIIILSKIIRYTIMYDVLVETGIGHLMLPGIVNNTDTVLKGASDISIDFFDFFNFFNLQTYIQFEIAVTIIFNTILVIFLSIVKTKLTILETIFLCSSIAVLNIFSFTLSKEPIQMLFFILWFLVLNSNLAYVKKIIVTVVVILFTAMMFRSYYILAALFFVITIILCEWLYAKFEGKQIIKVISMLILIGVIYFVFLNVSLLLFPTEYLELIRVRLRAAGAASDITTWIPLSNSNTLIFCADYILIIIRMMLPVELLLLGVKYIPFVIYQAIISTYAIKNFKNLRNMDQHTKLAFYVFLAFLFTSATFEPDFGSWIRHESVFCPVFLIMTQLLKAKRKTNIKIKINL